jgi:hypothetical protein
LSQVRTERLFFCSSCGKLVPVEDYYCIEDDQDRQDADANDRPDVWVCGECARKFGFATDEQEVSNESSSIREI